MKKQAIVKIISVSATAVMTVGYVVVLIGVIAAAKFIGISQEAAIFGAGLGYFIASVYKQTTEILSPDLKYQKAREQLRMQVNELTDDEAS